MTPTIKQFGRKDMCTSNDRDDVSACLPGDETDRLYLKKACIAELTPW